MDQAFKFDDPGWTLIGEMLATRSGHRSISTENSIIHIGGIEERLVHKENLVSLLLVRCSQITDGKYTNKSETRYIRIFGIDFLVQFWSLGTLKNGL